MTVKDGMTLVTVVGAIFILGWVESQTFNYQITCPACPSYDECASTPDAGHADGGR